MANALKNAPFKEEGLNGEKEQAFLDQKFDPNKKYMFELAQKNAARDIPIVDIREKREIVQDFRPYQNIVFSSQIVWNGQRANIRYYDGCDSIFVASQPKDKDTIDQLIRQTKRRGFSNGKFGVYGDDKQLILYMLACSWNVDSPFRTRTASVVFRQTNTDAIASEKLSKLELIEEAMKLAREATDAKMKIHAAFIGIPEIDYDSGNDLSPKEIRLLYREEAAKNPKTFVESYGNKEIEVKYYIKKSLETKLIHHDTNPNKAVWGKNNTEICDISGLKSNEAISDRLFEFSQSEDGEEFLIQLKAFYNS